MANAFNSLEFAEEVYKEVTSMLADACHEYLDQGDGSFSRVYYPGHEIEADDRGCESGVNIEAFMRTPEAKALFMKFTIDRAHKRTKWIVENEE